MPQVEGMQIKEELEGFKEGLLGKRRLRTTTTRKKRKRNNLSITPGSMTTRWTAPRDTTPFLGSEEADRLHTHKDCTMVTKCTWSTLNRTSGRKVERLERAALPTLWRRFKEALIRKELLVRLSLLLTQTRSRSRRLPWLSSTSILRWLLPEPLSRVLLRSISPALATLWVEVETQLLRMRDWLPESTMT